MSTESSVKDDAERPSVEERASTPQETESDVLPWSDEEAVTSADATSPSMPYIIEGTVVESTLLASNHGGSLGRRRLLLRQGLFVGWMALTLVLVLIVVEDHAPGLLGPLATLVPGLAPSATVTIMPVQSTLSTTLTIPAIMGPSDPAGPHVHARLVSVSSPTRIETVPTTGTGHRPAQQAHGTLTFYNAAPYPQTVTAGTALTGADGVQVMTDQAAIIPAGNPPTEGQVTIAAAAVQPGPKGNITAHDINGPCCLAYVLVQNAAAFSGGREARTYPLVRQQDIDRVAGQLSATLAQQTQTLLQAQVRPNEQWAAPAQCRLTLHTDHAAGSEASQVTVTVLVTCTGAVYDQQGLQQIATDRLTQQATATLGSGYTLQGAVTATVAQVTPLDTKGTFTLIARAEGIWVYQFSAADMHRFTTLVAGKQTQDAARMLLQQGHLHAVSITLADGGGTTLPADPTEIRVVVLDVSGGQESQTQIAKGIHDLNA